MACAADTLSNDTSRRLYDRYGPEGMKQHAGKPTVGLVLLQRSTVCQPYDCHQNTPGGVDPLGPGTVGYHCLAVAFAVCQCTCMGVGADGWGRVGWGWGLGGA